MAATDDHAVPSFRNGPLPLGFARRLVELAPWSSLAYVEADWRGTFVAVDRGLLALEPRDGPWRLLDAGATLWLCGLGLVALHNPGADATLLVAISRSCGS